MPTLLDKSRCSVAATDCFHNLQCDLPCDARPKHREANVTCQNRRSRVPAWPQDAHASSTMNTNSEDSLRDMHDRLSQINRNSTCAKLENQLCCSCFFSFLKQNTWNSWLALPPLRSPGLRQSRPGLRVLDLLGLQRRVVAEPLLAAGRPEAPPPC